MVACLPLLAEDSARQSLIDSWNLQRVRYSVLIEGFVIMPDHVHLLLRGLADDVRKFMQYSLAETSRHIRMATQLKARTGDLRSQARLGVITAKANGVATGKVWKERFRCTALDHQKDVLEKLEYIHRNPMKRGLCADVGEWSWSSYSHYTGGDCVLLVDDVLSCGNSD